MRACGKAMLIILVAALLLSVQAFAAGDVEYRPGEKGAENLFNIGIGKPWVSGDPFKSSMVPDQGQNYGVQNPLPSYQIIGYLNVAGGLIIAADNGNSLKLNPGPGNYPVYGYYKGNKLTGLFIDFS